MKKFLLLFFIVGMACGQTATFTDTPTSTVTPTFTPTPLNTPSVRVGPMAVTTPGSAAHVVSAIQQSQVANLPVSLATIAAMASVPTPNIQATMSPTIGYINVKPYGYTTVGMSNSGTGGKLQANSVYLPFGGQVTDLDVYCSSGAGQSIIVGVYDDLNNMPFRLVVNAPGQIAVNGWNKFIVPNVVLSPGNYWIALEGSINVPYDAGIGTYFYDSMSYSDPLPALAVTDAGLHFQVLQLSMYFNALSASTGTNTPTPGVGTPTATPTITSIIFPISKNPNNGFLLPPMAWDDWANPGPGWTTEAIVHGVANAMVTNGLLAAGYTGVYLDAGWNTPGSVPTTFSFNATNFPSGGNSLTSYLHSRGMKLGLYSSIGNSDCINGPGMAGYEQANINIMSAWGVDYFSVDTCSSDPINQYHGYRAIHDAITNPSPFHNMFFAICYTDGSANLRFIPSLCNMARIGADGDGTWSSVLYNIDRDAQFSSLSRPGFINQPFLATFGTGVLTQAEEETEFSMYCELAAPLIWGASIPGTNTPSSSISILCNTDAIAVDQDPLVSQGVTVESSDSGNCQVFSKVMSGNNVRAVALFNRDSSAQTMTVHFVNCGIPAGLTYTVRDLWAHASQGIYTNSYSCVVASHATTLLTLTPYQLPDLQNISVNNANIESLIVSGAASFSLQPVRGVPTPAYADSAVNRTYADACVPTAVATVAAGYVPLSGNEGVTMGGLTVNAPVTTYFGSSSGYNDIISTVAGWWGIRLKGAGTNVLAEFLANGATGEIKIGSSFSSYFAVIYANNTPVIYTHSEAITVVPPAVFNSSVGAATSITAGGAYYSNSTPVTNIPIAGLTIITAGKLITTINGVAQ